MSPTAHCSLGTKVKLAYDIPDVQVATHYKAFPGAHHQVVCHAPAVRPPLPVGHLEGVAPGSQAVAAQEGGDAQGP